MLFGAAALPLTYTQLQHLDATRRRMLRSIAGWVRYPEDDWLCTAKRVIKKLAHALAEFPMTPWSEQVATRQHNLAVRVLSKQQSWPLRAARWGPSAPPAGEPSYSRSPGRPRRKWDDYLNTFSDAEFHKKWFEINPFEWAAKQREFIDFVVTAD